MFVKCCRPNGLSFRDLLIGLHFAWQCPTQESGAATFQMSRSTHLSLCWRPVVLLANLMKEIQLQHRYRNVVVIEGTSAFVTLMTDTTDIRIKKPAEGVDRRRCWSFKNKKWGHRVGICVSRLSGDICHLTRAYPAGQCNDILVNRAERIPTLVKFFERIGADGIYRCRSEPVYVTPERKPARRGADG